MYLVRLKKIISYIPYTLFLLFLFIGMAWGTKTSVNSYVGSRACKHCHEQEYQNYIKYARKSHSFDSVLKMKKGLTKKELERCYDCHTTGHGKPGGFVSVEKTPELKNAGCEVCHGPGKAHVRSGNPADIERVVTLDVCKRCHTPERVRAFRYRPLLHGGGH